MIRRTLVDFIKANVSSLDGRVYPWALPSNLEDYPAVTIMVERSRGLHDKGGPSGPREATVEISVWSDRALDAEDVAEAMRAELDGFRGSLGPLTVKRTASGDERDVYDDRIGVGGVLTEYTIMFELP